MAMKLQVKRLDNGEWMTLYETDDMNDMRQAAERYGGMVRSGVEMRTVA